MSPNGWNVIPARFQVFVTRRPKYACRSCTNGVVQAKAPARLIPGGLPTEAISAIVNGHKQSRIDDLLPWDHAATA